jgi:ABC-type multidrug transport system ATPase subunit
MDEALDFADIFMILHKGRLFAYGSLKELRIKAGMESASLGEIFVRFTGGS